jgi:hypothetical protein
MTLGSGDTRTSFVKVGVPYRRRPPYRNWKALDLASIGQVTVPAE